MTNRANRRDFLKTTGAAGIGFYLAAGASAEPKKVGPNDTIQFACIGVGGKGSSDAVNAAMWGDIAAICDTNAQILAKAKKRYPKAKVYTDFRKLIDENHKSLDAVMVSTPDHTHAVAALMAMRRGLHCHCQKPLAHSVYEARQMAKVAKEQGIATQMGNQGSAHDALRKAAAIIKSGKLGKAKEVHIWTNRPVWPQGGGRPEPAKCPEWLAWDIWLGPAPKRPYANGYQPLVWRGFWDFGSGAIGDMACHTMNMPFAALDLRDPVKMTAFTSGHNKETYPASSKIVYEFGQNGDRAPINMTWYDGGQLPRLMPKIWRALAGLWKSGEQREAMIGFLGKDEGRTEEGCLKLAKKWFEDGKQSAQGSMIICEKGIVFSPDDYAEQFAILDNIKGDSCDILPKPEVDFVKAPGVQYEDGEWIRYMKEWINAIRTGSPTFSNFTNYAAPLTEMGILGNLAVWADGPTVEWDAAGMKSTNIEGLENIIKPKMREGWSLDL